MLVNYLQKQGIGLNGVVLLSSVLDFSLDWDINFSPTAIGGGDWAFPLYLPTEAASAWYRHALPGPPTTLAALLPEVEAFAMGEYLNALAAGSKLSPGEYNDVVAKLHQYTGLSEHYIRLSNLRIPYWRYATELFRDSGVMLGRYDSRYTSFNLDRINDRPPFDPVDSAIDAAFVATGNYFMRQVLGYQTTLIYRPVINVFPQWDWKHNGALPTNTAQDLAAAMAFDPNLQIFSGNGYYDFATPFWATVYTLNHLMLPAAAAEEHYVRLLRIGAHGLSTSRGACEIPRRPRRLVRPNAAIRQVNVIAFIVVIASNASGFGDRSPRASRRRCAYRGSARRPRFQRRSRGNRAPFPGKGSWRSRASTLPWNHRDSRQAPRRQLLAETRAPAHPRVVWRAARLSCAQLQRRLAKLGRAEPARIALASQHRSRQCGDLAILSRRACTRCR